MARRHDLHVAELTGHAVLAALDLAVLQDRAADPRTERDHDEVVLAAARAEAPLRPGRRVGVVVDHDGDDQAGGDGVAQGFVAPGEVRGEQDLRAVGVHPARRADAHRVDVVPVGEVQDQLDDGVLDDLRALGLVRRLGAQLFQDVAVGVHDARHHLRTADVDPDRGDAGGGEVRAALLGADGLEDGGAGGAAVCEVAVRAHRPCGVWGAGPLSRPAADGARRARFCHCPAPGAVGRGRPRRGGSPLRGCCRSRPRRPGGSGSGCVPARG